MDSWKPLVPDNHSSNGHALSKHSTYKPAYSTSGRWIGRLPESLHLIILSFLPVPDLPQVARCNKAFGVLVKDDKGWERRWLDLGIPKEEWPGHEAEKESATSRSARTNSIGKEDSAAMSPASTAVRPSIELSPGVIKSPVKVGFREVGAPAISPSNRSRGFSINDDFGDFSSISLSKPVDQDDFGDFVDVPVGSDGKPIPAGEKSLMDFGDEEDLPLPKRFEELSHQHNKHNKIAVRTNGFFAIPTSSLPQRGGIPNSSSLPKINTTQPYLTMYKTHHLAMLPLTTNLRSSPTPTQTLALLFPSISAPSLPSQSKTLISLLNFLSPVIQPLLDWAFLRQTLLAAADRFDGMCLSGFEQNDNRGNQEQMKLFAECGWSVWWSIAKSNTVIKNGKTIKRRSPNEWEVGRVWIERREIFYEGSSVYDPNRNIITNPGHLPQLNFEPMDKFLTHALDAITTSGKIAFTVFPIESDVLLEFSERVCTDVIGEYVGPLLMRTREVGGDEMFLRATAATFAMVWRLVEVVLSIGGEAGKGGKLTRTRVEDIVFRMFESNMDEYLDEEMDWVKNTMSGLCKDWNIRMNSTAGATASSASTTFLTSQNPAQVKRNVLASFRDALLLPVTIIPKTVNMVATSAGGAMVSGVQMLNPQRWTGGAGTVGLHNKSAVATTGDQRKSLDDTAAIPDGTTEKSPPQSSLVPPASLVPPETRPATPTSKTFESLQLLISLDVALELIQANREALKRVETFQKYPGKTGHRVQETIEEVFILLLQAMSDQHLAPGFQRATEQMKTYKPADHEETTSVAPLLQFFELVHVGDTIQSMMQVYFDKEMAPHIDRTDFLNGVVREKKRFENVLDEAVAAGLNAGIEVLMNQVEHIIIIRTGPREYYPLDDSVQDLGPTRGCREAVACLQTHCDLLKGSTSKDVLEVFYQEVGIRLQSIVQKHLKRQIISLSGGFQIISDLNTYFAFVASLKQQRITDAFSNLKMIGHVYVVEDAKDLAGIVRDVTRYGGAYQPEDVYEFIQRRADWKKIEKTVDKSMYSLSLKEDCCIM